MNTAATAPAFKVATSMAMPILALRVPKSTYERATVIAVNVNRSAPTIRYPLTCFCMPCAYSSYSFGSCEISGGLFIGSEQIKQREHKNPDQVDKVPEKAAHLDAIRQMFRVALIDFFADRQPHINKHDHSAQHVQAV